MLSYTMPVVLVYGLGNFGYAILKHLDRHKHAEYMIAAFDRDPAVMKRLGGFRRHTRIKPQHRISKSVLIPEKLEEIFPQVDIIILAVTAASFPEVLGHLNRLPRGRKKLLVINAAKALASGTGQRLETVVEEQLQHPYEYAYLAGGTIAEDLYNSHPLGATIAARSLAARKRSEALLGSSNFRLYQTSDVAGAEYCAAFKNVISIFAGIISGLGWPYGSETYFISRFSREVERFVVKELKGRPTTFSMDSQCWGNDLWMSCTGKTRNREFGYLIGRGDSVRQAEKRMRQARKSVEGLTTVRVLPQLSDRLSQYPFLHTMREIIINGKEPATTIARLIEAKII